MKKKNLLVFIIIIIFIAIVISLLVNRKISEVCLGEMNECFSVEIADNVQEREQGLMFRESLSEDSGMLFVFEKEEIYPFWMKNTLIPLDIIWINSSGEVVFIEENAQPCKSEICESYSPETDALYVLELNGGKSEEINLEIGNFVVFK